MVPIQTVTRENDRTKTTEKFHSLQIAAHQQKIQLNVQVAKTEVIGKYSRI